MVVQTFDEFASGLERGETSEYDWNEEPRAAPARRFVRYQRRNEKGEAHRALSSSTHRPFVSSI